MKLLLLFSLLGAVRAQWDPNFVPGRAGIVHLFEWHWGTIAEECETFLGPNKFAGVQISPPNENRVVDGRPWWERYQPISYVIETRSGNIDDFKDMVDRCNAVGVRIYADMVVNHMCGDGGDGFGTAGSYFDTQTRNFPQYSRSDFNDDICYTQSGGIENYQNVDEVRNCKLVGLLDLRLSSTYVRDTVRAFFNDLIFMGVAGFRIDACKHMWPGDLKVVLDGLDPLPTHKGFPVGARAFIAQEVIDQGGEPIKASEYFDLGRVTEFKYGMRLGENKDAIHYLSNFGEQWGLMPDGNALVFLNNHDNQRGHGGGGSIVSFDDGYNLKILTAFMMAWDYGVPRIMSSYYFSHGDEGPPLAQRSVNGDGSCGNGWVCEHRWRQIKNMAHFAGSAQGSAVENWWGENNQIAFSRGTKAFIAINKAGHDMSGTFYSGLPGGEYCNVFRSDFDANGNCDQCVYVDGSGMVDVYIQGGDADPVIAVHVGAPCSGGTPTDPGTGTPPPSGGDCESCSSCSAKVDCGFMGSTQTTCEADGCLWCPAASGSSDPWCIKRSGGSGGSSGGSSCNVDDNAKADCGYMGMDKTQCESQGCCWAESNASGVPWCFYPA